MEIASSQNALLAMTNKKGDDMESRVKFLGHPIHPMLIVFPLGLLATALLFDIIYMVGEITQLGTAAYWMIGAGVIGGIIAAAFGLLDWLAIPGGSRAKSIGLMHGLGNLMIVALFAVSLSMRYSLADHLPTVTNLVIEIVGGILALGTAWLGGELVDRLGVGVDKGANVNASSSLSGQPAYQETKPAAAPETPPSTTHQ